MFRDMVVEDFVHEEESVAEEPAIDGFRCRDIQLYCRVGNAELERQGGRIRWSCEIGGRGIEGFRKRWPIVDYGGG